MLRLYDTFQMIAITNNFFFLFEHNKMANCLTKGCEYLQHSNVFNNNGFFCCKACKNNNGHGHCCEKKPKKTKLIIEHNAGFFSCCSVKLHYIVMYFNKNKKLPDEVDSSKQFLLYKNSDALENKDASFEFFEHYDKIKEKIQYTKQIGDFPHNDWSSNYKKLDYVSIQPFINKYFTPTKQIMNTHNSLIAEFGIDINNCIGVYIRGTDKYIDTPLGSYDDYYRKIKQVMEMNKPSQVLLQSDDGGFLNYMKEKEIPALIIVNKTSVSYNKTGAHFTSSIEQNFKDIQYLISIFLIVSKCKYIVCNSSNCSLFIMYYRGNSDNVHQFSNNVWNE
jgi:hypothetical protein